MPDNIESIAMPYLLAMQDQLWQLNLQPATESVSVEFDQAYIALSHALRDMMKLVSDAA